MYKLFFFFGVLAVLMGTAGCSKDGRAIVESKESDFAVQALTADSMRLGIKIDGEVVVNDLFTPTSASRIIPIKFFNKNKKVTIYNVADNRVLFDSLFVVNTNSNSITLFQKNPGESLIYIAPPAGESLPPADWAKIQLIYTFPQLPERVKVVVENSITGGVDYHVTDSFLLDKGEFSRWFLGRTNSLRRPQVNFYSADTARKLLAIADRGEFSNMNLDFTIYAIRTYKGISNNVYSLINEKLY